ncbi:recombinase family protein [Limosilactobacillus sp. RRLNB_1_1]|uniref:Recombinase family protein n=1 Tax=Limosilactobacillus albertensis TaxID=2759752 RepID=A0A7W3TQC5_9LACO|nr:recombinase family protein [Limosilactobacillus albertensis]MBB1068934.1 recombinase family protein [Limosilactobacillus albertensis]MCD7118694.1 recombinase family protein [Limosilactobacillus albertensis]MCD7128157.1 recombinase family protein [Limosilactobacillus albertensis]
MSTITKIHSYQRDLQQLRVAAYCRVSTDNVAQLESLENQRQHYQNYIKQHPNWQLAKIYFDEGISGTHLKQRNALKKLLADCHNHQIDLVITKSISRLSRNTTDCLQIVRELQRLNIPIYFEKERINTGEMASELFLSILSSIAQDESHSTAGNLRWSIRKRFADGSFRVSSAPYGYSIQKGNLKIKPYEARIVKQIFGRFLQGDSTGQIAKWLNTKHIPTQRGHHWWSSTIINILRNINYTGDMLCQKTYRDAQYHRHFNQGELAQYLIEDHHPPIISNHDFGKAQTLLKQITQRRHIESGSHKYQRHYLFTGKIVCGHCGSTFKRQTRPHRICWACQKHLYSAKQCPVKAVPEQDIQNAFCTMMNKLIFSRKFLLDPLVQELKENFNDPDGELGKLTNQIKANDQKAETLMSLVEEGLIDKGIYINQTAELEQSTYQCQQRIKQINSNNTDNANNLEDFRDLLRCCQQGQMLDDFDSELFKAFAQNIKVNSQHEIVFQLKCGLHLAEHLPKKTSVSQLFYRGVIQQRFNEPIKQAEYLYSIIKSEVDLIG